MKFIDVLVYPFRLLIGWFKKQSISNTFNALRVIFEFIFALVFVMIPTRALLIRGLEVSYSSYYTTDPNTFMLTVWGLLWSACGVVWLVYSLFVIKKWFAE